MRWLLLLLSAACGGARPVAPLDAGVDAGFTPAPAAQCDVPPMDQLYPGKYPPNPYGPALVAAPCMTQAHDAALVLGCPSELDGGPSDCQIKRADLASGLRSLVQWFIVSGGAAHNQFVEADSLQALLVARGVDAASILLDRKAKHTDENIYYGSQIMKAQGLVSALVISEDPGQLVFTAVCDSNCCVDLGRLTVVEFPDGTKYGHYVLYPAAVQVGDGECAQIEIPNKFMCTNMSTRNACAGNIHLSGP